MSKMRQIIGGVVFFIAALIAVVFLATSGIVKTADAFFAAVQAGDYENAYQNMTAIEFKEYTSYDDFVAAINDYALQTYVKSTWSSRSVENDIGSLMGTIELSDGTVYETEMQFWKENGEWKVGYFLVEAQDLAVQ